MVVACVEDSTATRVAEEVSVTQDTRWLHCCMAFLSSLTSGKFGSNTCF